MRGVRSRLAPIQPRANAHDYVCVGVAPSAMTWGSGRFPRLTRSRSRCLVGLLLIVVSATVSCDLSGPTLIGVPVETRFAFVNFSKTHYASLAVRIHCGDDCVDPTSEYVKTPLLAPGAIYRVDFRTLLGTGCPDALDFRLFVYRRANADVPIGLDDGEVPEQDPVVAGTLENIPACNVQALVGYTVVNWDAPDGTARVKIAQGSAVETALRDSGEFANVDVAWELEGVDPALADQPPPALAPAEPIGGRVTLADGSGVEGVGVLIRSRFRVRLDDADSDNDPDAGFSDPIAFTTTDADGAFSIDRPAGGYRVEFFSDDSSFRPPVMDLETPVDVIQVIAEPL